MAIFLYTLLGVGALGFADYALCQLGPAGLRRLYLLIQLPERTLSQTWTTPALVRGALHTAAPRHSPSGRASTLWYAWVELVEGSGKNTRRTLLCARGEDTELELRQAERVARLDLFADKDHIALLKGTPLETLPLDRVALDLGPLYQPRQVPQPMRTLCAGKLPTVGTLHYSEASLPPGTPVTVLGCKSAAVVHSCGTPPGAISRDELRPVLRAYANDTLNPIRGAAALVGFALSLLAAALFKLRAGNGGAA
jgi:hypothetical protein